MSEHSLRVIHWVLVPAAHKRCYGRFSPSRACGKSATTHEAVQRVTELEAPIAHPDRLGGDPEQQQPGDDRPIGAA